MVREWVAVILGVLGVTALTGMLITLAVDGEWGRLVLVGIGVTLLLAARSVGRYDPAEAALRRAARAELRNRARSG